MPSNSNRNPKDQIPGKFQKAKKNPNDKKKPGSLLGLGI
jgi:hypothetical protein